MVQSAVRQPRALIRINGQPTSGWTTCEVEENAFAQPDTFRCEFAIKGLPADQSLAWFASQRDLEFEVLDGFPADPDNFSASDLTTRIVGNADQITPRLERGVIEVNGRDLTAALLDAKTSEKFTNQTASEVAITLAQRHGLTPVVTPTQGKVGRFYQLEHVALQDDRPEWDLLTWLARETGSVTFVRGRELHFEPAPNGDVDPYLLEVALDEDGDFTGEFATLSVTRELTVAKDLSVTVRSWNAKSKKAFSKKATRYKSGGKNVQHYVRTIAGLTPEQAQLRANQILLELSKHEMKLAWTGPGDPDLNMSRTISLQGTETAFDQTYYPDTIERTISPDGGYVMSVTAKNHSPETEANL